MDLRKTPNRYSSCTNDVELLELRTLYTVLCEFVSMEYFDPMIQTESEDRIYGLIKKNTKLEVLRSVWIGNMNIDLFIPSVRSVPGMNNGNGRSLKGIAIEVDGCIHNKIFKMKKDNKKYETLHGLSIGTLSVENQDFKNETVQNLISNLKNLKKLDTRAKKRLMRNIYYTTLIAHKDVILKYDWPRGKSFLKLIGEL